MIEHLFFNMDGQIEEIVKRIFASLGIENNIQEGESNHILTGIYYSYSIFGLQVKLEKNSYNYDDNYNYMVGIRKDVLSDLQVDDIVLKHFTDIILNLLVNNLQVPIAYEVADGRLQIFSR